MAPSPSPAAAAGAVEEPFGRSSASDDVPGGVTVFTSGAASLLAAADPVPATDGRVHLAYELQVTNIRCSRPDEPDLTLAQYGGSWGLEVMSYLPAP